MVCEYNLLNIKYKLGQVLVKAPWGVIFDDSDYGGNSGRLK